MKNVCTQLENAEDGNAMLRVRMLQQVCKVELRRTSFSAKHAEIHVYLFLYVDFP